jgi:hypothetical protein
MALRLGEYDVPNPLPLSFMQRWWWDLEQVVGPTFQPAWVIRMLGGVDHATLERTLEELIRRHEALRTRFIATGRTVRAVIDPPTPVSIHVENCSTLGSPERESRIRQLIEEFRLQAVALDGGPLFRATLVKVTGCLSVILLGVHHIVIDHTSFVILHRELQAIYAAYRVGQRSPLPQPELRLSEFSIWEHSWLHASGVEDPLAYWECRLADVRPMQLPPDLPCMERGSGAPEGICPLEIPASTMRALRLFGQAHRSTLQVVLLALYSLLLSSWSGQRQVLIGNYMIYRPTPGSENLVGCFSSNRPILVVIDLNTPFTENFNRTRQAYIEALNFRRLVGMPLAWSKRLNNVIANFSKSGRGMTSSRPGSGAGSRPVHHELALVLEETPAGIRGVVSYAANLFAEETIKAFCGAFHALASEVSDGAEPRVPKFCGRQ